MRTKDKVICITGASSGIGKALAYEFAKKGYTKLSLCARRTELLEEIKKDIESKYNHVKVYYEKVDVVNENEVKSWIDNTVKTFGKIDVMIANAGITMRAIVLDVGIEVLRKVMEVNYWGMVYCVKHSLEHIINTKGTIIGISSIAGFRGLPTRCGYSASKFAMNGFLESLRTELYPTGANVMIVAPGFTSSEIRFKALTAKGELLKDSPIKENKIMTSEEAAEIIVKAEKKRKKYVIMTAQGKLTVWLNRLIPGWIDGMIFKHFLKEPDSPLVKYIKKGRS